MYEINENEDKDGKHSIKKNLCLKSNLSMIEINNFIEKCIKIFDDYQEKQTSKGPFIFNYKGKKNDFPIFDKNLVICINRFTVIILFEGFLSIVSLAIILF